MNKIYDRIFIGNLTDCFYKNKNEWAVIHACKHPCHQRALRYKGNLKSTHPHYLIYEKGNHLFLNIVDMTKPLKHKFMIPIITEVYAFIDKNIKKRNILIHCMILGEKKMSKWV